MQEADTQTQQRANKDGGRKEGAFGRGRDRQTETQTGHVIKKRIVIKKEDCQGEDAQRDCTRARIGILGCLSQHTAASAWLHTARQRQAIHQLKPFSPDFRAHNADANANAKKTTSVAALERAFSGSWAPLSTYVIALCARGVF